MFRRRGLVRAARRAAFAPDVPPMLRRGNELMAAGQYTAAAEIFEQFARGAMQRGGPRAAWLFLQAGRARILAGQIPVGMVHLQQGLAIFAARGQLPELHRAGKRVMAELRERGLANEAGQIEATLKSALPSGFTAGSAAGLTEKPRPVLPTNCSGCGAPIRADEVEWVDEITVVCPYCGSAVRAGE